MIALLAAVVAYDAAPPPDPLPGAGGWALVLAPFAVIAAMTHLVCWGCGRELDGRGRWRSVVAADRMLAASRLMIVGTHWAAVLSLGWVAKVRAVVGDLVIVDEALALLPALLTIAAGWWSYWPIDRRIREASMVRVLEEGHPAYPVPTRWQYVVSNVRHQMLLTLVPLLMLAAWSEAVNFGLEGALRRAGDGTAAGRLGAWLKVGGRLDIVDLVVRLLGWGVVFSLAPAVLRVVWDTVPLGRGPLRDRLMGVAERARVRVGEVLVWRTHGTMINGAAIGLVPWLRYILLTDSLLDQLPQRQVEAVMGHEVGHVKHRHIVWLVGAMFASLGVGTTLVGLLAWGLGRLAGVQVSDTGTVVVREGSILRHAAAEMLVGAGALGGLVLGIAAFGAVSRRFEWQADAFAVRQLSADSPPPPPEGVGGETLAAVPPARAVVTAEAAEAMSGALASVARLNHIPPSRRSFRHGSIAVRQRKIMALVGTPLDRLAPDAASRRVKALIVLGVGVVIGSLVWEQLSAPPPRPGPAGSGPAQERRP